jgi:hypothetical protein
LTGAAGDAVMSGATRDLLGEPFRLDSISEVAAPEGAEGLWQQYVIVQGTNTIKGLRAGTRAEVNLQVESMVERLNERFRKSQTGLTSSTGRKPPPRVGRQDTAPKTAVANAPADSSTANAPADSSIANAPADSSAANAPADSSIANDSANQSPPKNS